MNQEQAAPEVTRLVDDWIVAETRGDTAFLDRVLADDFVAVGPLGFMLTKPEWIGRHRAGDFFYRALDLDEVTTRVYDNTAVVVGRQTQEATFRGNRVPMTELRATMVLARPHGNWQLVGVHMSPIGKPPSFARAPVEGS